MGKYKLTGLLAVLALASLGVAQESSAAKLVGKKAPKLIVKNWHNSKPLSLDKLKGKVVILDFWAHW